MKKFVENLGFLFFFATFANIITKGNSGNIHSHVLKTLTYIYCL